MRLANITDKIHKFQNGISEIPFVILKKIYGPGGSSGKALGYGLDGPGSIPGV